MSHNPPMGDPGRTVSMQAGPSLDPNRTILGAPPTVDPNKTIMGNAPSINMTATIKPVQCPVCKSFNPPGLIYCGDCGLIFEMALEGDAFGAPAVQVPVLVESTSGREHKIRPGILTLGRQGDIVIEDTRASRRHCQIECTSTCTIEDLGSTNGTLVNGSRLAPGQKVELKTSDKVSLGGFELTFAAPGEASKTLMALGGKTSALAAPPTAGEFLAWINLPDGEKPLRAGSYSFGRRSTNELVISDPFVSGVHGKVEVREDGVFLTDTGSTNGTLVNEAKLSVDVATQIRATDVIKLGSLEITFRFKE